MLTIQYIPYSEISQLSPARRIKKILEHVKENKIVLLEGRLKKSEEAELIKITMEQISDKFRGIEISIMDPEKEKYDFTKKLKSSLVELLLGDRQGFTIIGPASIIKEIKKDPNKVQLLTEEIKEKSKHKKNKRK